jgi:HlyD family secretion protein
VPPNRLPHARRLSKAAKLVLTVGALVLLVGAGSGAYLMVGRGLRNIRTDLVTHVVHREKLLLTIVERGALESAENNDIVCRVKAGTKNSTVATTIKWVIDDGSHVKRGDLLVDLDDSGLQEQLKTQKITMDTAEGKKIQAEEAYKIVQSQNESDLKSAEITLQLAKLDLKKYADGDYPQALKQILGDISMSESDVEQQRDRSAWALRMMKKGYYTSSQAQAEQSKLDGYELILKKNMEIKRVLTDYTKEREITFRTNAVAEAERALERTKAQASAKEIQARTDRETNKSIYEQERKRYEEVEEEIRKCRVYSPQDGLVVYYIPEQSRFGSGTQQSIVAQGEPVREGQKLMRIPDLHKMLVNTKVHEALVSRVRGEITQPTGFGDCVNAALSSNPGVLTQVLGLFAFSDSRDQFKEYETRVVRKGQDAQVRIDAYPDRALPGHVKSVATVASQQDWMTADVKTYQTMVAIDEEVENLKPGMSGEVTIFINDALQNVLTVPLQGIVGTPSMGSHRKVFVLTPEGAVEERDVVVGLSNDRMAEIRSGLEEGEQVILNTRAVLGEKSKLKPATARGGPEDTSSEFGDKSGEKKKGARGKGGFGPNGFPGKGGPDGFPGGPDGGPGGMKGFNGMPPGDFQKRAQEAPGKPAAAAPDKGREAPKAKGSDVAG